jgi:mannose/fructose/N-acetylgalactosamine-specific phosphotransferase system component IID
VKLQTSFSYHLISPAGRVVSMEPFSERIWIQEKDSQSNYSKSLIKMNPQWYNGSNAINPLDY